MNATVTAEKLLATLSSDPLVTSGAAIAVACTCLITYFASSLTRVEHGKKVALRALKAVASASKAMAYADGKIDAKERALLLAIVHRLGGSAAAEAENLALIDALPVLTPAELAAAVPSQRARELMMILLIHMALVDEKMDKRESDLCETYSHALNIHPNSYKDMLRSVRMLQKSAKHDASLKKQGSLSRMEILEQTGEFLPALDEFCAIARR